MCETGQHYPKVVTVVYMEAGLRSGGRSKQTAQVQQLGGKILRAHTDVLNGPKSRLGPRHRVRDFRLHHPLGPNSHS